VPNGIGTEPWVQTPIEVLPGPMVTRSGTLDQVAARVFIHISAGI
jgi:hypothetical protein